MVLSLPIPSIFIRKCEKCTILTACQQFRLRESNDIRAFVASVSDPIIEISSSIYFAPYQLFYPDLTGSLFVDLSRLPIFL